MLDLSSRTVTLERRIEDAVEAARGELIDLTARLIAFDTTARELEDPPRDEADLQEYLGDRLRAAGAIVDIWEPEPGDVAGTRQIPDGPRVSPAGRRWPPGSPAPAGGRSLLFNGHIDVVPSEPRERWTSDPNQPRCATASSTAAAPAT